MAGNKSQFCICMAGEKVSAPDRKMLTGFKAALLKGAKWDLGQLIKIRFLSGEPELRARVKEVALEWTKRDLANLRLNFVESGPTDIRIDFMQGKGSWSYLGTVCRTIAEPLPTMNFGWLKPSSSDKVLRSVVLHEFGHALGLIHEHQNPQGGIDWDRDAVRRSLSGYPNYWSDEKIEFNMFKKYEPSSVLATNVDPLSIMMYPIPQDWTRDGFSAGFNAELSANDKLLIQRAYPR